MADDNQDDDDTTTGLVTQEPWYKRLWRKCMALFGR